ncbi:unnamed protein product [Auanema sp. JU1783]|nr:unnamed protein product [Auanema sp. JU1783]
MVMRLILVCSLLSTIISAMIFTDNQPDDINIIPLEESLVMRASVPYETITVQLKKTCRAGGLCHTNCYCPGRCLVGRYNLSRRCFI